MKTYRVPVVWQMYGYVEVEADSVSEAIQAAMAAPLPDDGSYIEGSFEVDDSLIDMDEGAWQPQKTWYTVSRNMITYITWKKIKSNCLKNLYVAFNQAGEPVGMIDKPVDTKHSKNWWRMYHGTGDNAKFLGHSIKKKEAMNHVHWAVEMNSATIRELNSLTIR